MLEAHAKSITVVFTAVMGFSTSVKTRRGKGKQTNQTQSASGEILGQFAAASIGRHDVERICVYAEKLTLEKTVEIATDLEANLKGLDAQTNLSCSRSLGARRTVSLPKFHRFPAE